MTAMTMLVSQTTSSSRKGTWTLVMRIFSYLAPAAVWHLDAYLSQTSTWATLWQSVWSLFVGN